MKRLPSLDSLRAFEAAARHLSFTKAGEELHVTQSALSHRVNALEQELGLRLFRRLTRRMELTPEGERLAAGVRRGLDEMRAAVAAIGENRPGGPLSVSALPSFAARWLVPRLQGFRARHPEIDVRITADSSLANLRAGEADLALRFGAGRYPGLHVTALMPDCVLPVCSPRLVRQLGEIARPDEIQRYPLLHDVVAEGDGSGADWPSWLRHVGAAQVDCREGVRFNQATLTLEAAVNGLGVALARRSLIGADLAEGRLVALLPFEAPTAFAYYLVCLPESADRPEVARFRDWLLAEVDSAK